MIQEDKKGNAILAIHWLVVEARVMTANMATNEEIYDFLDEIHRLLGFTIAKEDLTDMFENYLKDICDERGFQRIRDYYTGKRIIRYANEIE